MSMERGGGVVSIKGGAQEKPIGYSKLSEAVGWFPRVGNVIKFDEKGHATLDVGPKLASCNLVRVKFTKTYMLNGFTVTVAPVSEAVTVIGHGWMTINCDQRQVGFYVYDMRQSQFEAVQKWASKSEAPKKPKAHQKAAGLSVKSGSKRGRRQKKAANVAAAVACSGLIVAAKIGPNEYLVPAIKTKDGSHEFCRWLIDDDEDDDDDEVQEIVMATKKQKIAETKKEEEEEEEDECLEVITLDKKGFDPVKLRKLKNLSFITKARLSVGIKIGSTKLAGSWCLVVVLELDTLQTIADFVSSLVAEQKLVTKGTKCTRMSFDSGFTVESTAFGSSEAKSFFGDCNNRRLTLVF